MHYSFRWSKHKILFENEWYQGRNVLVTLFRLGQ